jgi:hypothetical protein
MQRTCTHSQPRRGWTSLWLIVWLPVLLALFCGLIAVANLWLARVELENGLEAAALAAVKEWGDQGGGDTHYPRQIGIEFAAANSVRGQHLQLESNYAGSLASRDGKPRIRLVTVAPTGCNQNLTCAIDGGHLIFGAIDDSDPNNVIFDAGKCPSCLAGSVLFDATGSGNLRAENAWGISFHNSPNLPEGIRIERIVIDLRGSGGDGVFCGSEVLDADDPYQGWIMRDQSGPVQSDIDGFCDVRKQTEFCSLGQGKLQIDFKPLGNKDGGFEPGDRIRFGYEVDDVSSASGHNDGDGIGRDGATVTIFFNIDGSPLPPITGQFLDTTERHQDCLDEAVYNPITQSYAVMPKLNPIPDLPGPPTSSANNNGQSYVLLSAGASSKFGVRAQAMVEVPTLASVFLGNIGSSRIQAKATAEYDCLTRRVRLVRIDEFVCP